MKELDAVVVGAGQAGLAVSYELTRRDISHVVFERGRIGESWRSQRWDSFTLNTPNWANDLPGIAMHGPADRFSTRDEMVSYLEKYTESFSPPVRENTAVTSVTRAGEGFEVVAGDDTYRAANVVVCSGAMSRSRAPALAEKLPANVLSVPAGSYRNPSSLADGAVVVVGSGQSGCQIVEDLLEAGRRVFLCASKVGRSPRMYRGRDILAWGKDVGMFEMTPEQLENPAMKYAAQPQVSGTRGGHTISLQSLARDGAVLVGRVDDIDGDELLLGDTLEECVAFADQVSAGFKSIVDQYIERAGIDAPPPEPDPYEPPMPELGGSSQWRRLGLAEHGVSTVIWTTGFDADWSWLSLDIFDDRGQPRHDGGQGAEAGVFFCGMPWLRKRKSGILLGVSEDAAHVAALVSARCGS